MTIHGRFIMSLNDDEYVRREFASFSLIKVNLRKIRRSCRNPPAQSGSSQSKRVISEGGLPSSPCSSYRGYRLPHNYSPPQARSSLNACAEFLEVSSE